MPSHSLADLQKDDVVLDSLPDEVEMTVRQRDSWLRTLHPGGGGLEFLVSDVHRWNPGQTVRVAFLGGNAELHAPIAEATKEITDACNIVLDFGFDPNTKAFRTWSEQDTKYAAEIRVSFDKPGYFSLVGTDSVDPNIGLPDMKIGGRPHQCSLNLGGFTEALPHDWQRTARHEFLHAMSFKHAHQNMRGPCEQVFRWDDDEGYTSTKDWRGAFVADAAGRNPGIYTYLSGYPNFWKKDKVNFNLRTKDDPDDVAGPFDRLSVMLYRFPALYYKDANSTCLPASEGTSLSDGDRRGLRLLYPYTARELEAIAERRRKLLGTVENRAPDGLESDDSRNAYAVQLERLLRRSLG